MAGSDADIEAVSIKFSLHTIINRSGQVFELEEEMEQEQESALDMEEAPAIPPVDIRQRRQSTASRRRISASSTHSQNQNQRPQSSRHPSPSSSPRKHEQTSPLSLNVPLPLPRHRVNSIVTRGLDLAQSAPSPLAQIFQPLIVDDDMLEQADHSTTYFQDHTTPPDSQSHSPPQPPPATVGLVSYGPASRRRLTSIHRRTPTIGGGTTGESFIPQTHSPLAPLGMKRFPSAGGSRVIVSQPLSESPDERDKSVESERKSEGEQQQPETAARIEEEGSGNVWAFRLQKIEERQKRMEELLIKVVDKLEH